MPLLVSLLLDDNAPIKHLLTVSKMTGVLKLNFHFDGPASEALAKQKELLTLPAPNGNGHKGNGGPTSGVGRGNGQGQGITPEIMKFFLSRKKNAKPAHTDDLVKHFEAVKHPAKEAQIRSNIGTLVPRGLLKRVGGGLFELTDAGRNYEPSRFSPGRPRNDAPAQPDAEHASQLLPNLTKKKVAAAPADPKPPAQTKPRFKDADGRKGSDIVLEILKAAKRPMKAREFEQPVAATGRSPKTARTSISVLVKKGILKPTDEGYVIVKE